MLFSDAKGHKVVSTSTAQTVGKVASFVVDPATRKVVAVRIKKADSGDTLRWDRLVAFGVDAITITAADAITSADPAVEALTGKDHRILGKRVLTGRGDELGTVEDVEFDAATGAVTTLLLAGSRAVDRVDGDRLVGVGPWAVVVRAE